MGKSKKNIKKQIKAKIKPNKPKTAEEKEMASKISEAMSKIVEDAIGDELRAEENELAVKKAEKQKKVKKAAIIIGVILLALGSIYGGFAYHYTDKFFPRTTINNVDVAGLTEEQAETVIRNAVETYSVDIQFRGGDVESIVGNDINYSYVPSGEVGELLHNQKALKWISGCFGGNSYEVSYALEYDGVLLLDALMALHNMQPEQQIAPIDAYIDFVESEFVLVEESEGAAIDGGVLLKALADTVSVGGTELSVEDTGAYIRPTIFRDNENLLRNLDIYNEYAKASITYLFGETKEVLDGMIIKDWISYDEQGNPVEDEKAFKEHVADYVAQLAKKYNTVSKDRQIKNTATGEMEVVPGGNYGWKINQKEEAALLYEDIKAEKIIEREPVFAQEGYTWDEDDIGDTYVEVNLTKQHVWCYVDGKMVWESDCVSGTYNNKSRITPEGVFTVTYKQKNKVLRGRQLPDGTYEYESPVSYWMPFNKGIGFHDATWRGSFGGQIYKTNGSHGCINLPKKNAATLFDLIDKGTIVVVYY